VTTMPFGRYRGLRFSDIPTDYLRWLQSLDDLSAPLRRAVEAELRRRVAAGPADWEYWSPPPPPPPPPPPRESVWGPIVRQWHRKLVLKWHPDRGGSTDGMAAINDAYALLRETLEGLQDLEG
jgi:hypothetical protein